MWAAPAGLGAAAWGPNPLANNVTCPLQAVFDFLDVQMLRDGGVGGGGGGERGLAPGGYRLANAIPRRLLERGGAAAQSLEGAGLSHRQEALFVEPL